MSRNPRRIRGLSILITGGAGFIGSHLVESLLANNDVAVLDNFSSGKREYLAAHHNSPNFRLIEADLLSPGALDEALKTGGGDVMTDAVVKTWGFWFILYGQAGWSVEGDVVKTRKN